MLKRCTFFTFLFALMISIAGTAAQATKPAPASATIYFAVYQAPSEVGAAKPPNTLNV